MNQRTTKKFTVVEFDNKYVWLKLREGEKRGLQFAIPLNNGCQNKLEKLDQDEKITATLESMNERNTAWKCIDIQWEENSNAA